MENQKKKSFSYYMRNLHRDIGFFIIGMTIIFSLSGIVLIYRDTDFMKTEVMNQKELTPGLNPAKLGENLKIRDLKITKTEGDIVYFTNGFYNTVSGHTEFTAKVTVFPFNKLINLHKSISQKTTHYFITLFGGLLFFMAISAFWMFNPKTKAFKRGIILSILGVAFAFILLFTA